jgi:hypothetical protein
MPGTHRIGGNGLAGRALLATRPPLAQAREVPGDREIRPGARKGAAWSAVDREAAAGVPDFRSARTNSLNKAIMGFEFGRLRHDGQ